jgi:NAD(P)-dependent dehydrogenase (short-subunit alcohol dehydrogenase family)/rhamnose utilization protein RhaD (predicted bifunctional aldolase and dehydrogenase)
MENQWQSVSADSPDDALVPLQHLRQLLGDAPEILFGEIGSLSLKSEGTDPFGEPTTLLNYLRAGKETTPYQLADLKRIPAVKNPSLVQNALGQARLGVETELPDRPAVVHALIPDRMVCFCLPTAMLALDLLENPGPAFKAAFGDAVHFIEAEGPNLLKTVAEVEFNGALTGLYIHQHGLFAFGEDAETLYERIVALTSQAEQALEIPLPYPNLTVVEADETAEGRVSLAELRKALSLAAGTPLLMRTVTNSLLQDLARDTAVTQLLAAGPLTTAQAHRFGSGFIKADDLPESLPTNSALLNSELGLVVTAQTAVELEANLDLIGKTLQAVKLAAAAGSLAQEAAKPAKVPAAIQRGEHNKDTMFVGEIALVTGAASGIGRGCALSLLDRGAAVIGLDVSDSIKEVSDSPNFLGLVCDLTDETATAAAYEAAVRIFGGLDMIVLNAGIFTKSQMVKDLDMAMWQRVMHINLDANVTILRESYPLLKLAPDKGRVLVNASRNVPAPGPGAAAYSTSKAGLTQLARVAALEWGKDGIRVNMIHPHAVFDTGIWTDEVLQSRAEKYGVSVKEYKTRNVLKVELVSRDVGELVCEMLGPVFSKTTGAQVPVDGGCDRVI